MKRVAIIITIFCIFSFTGCATTTLKDLKENPAGKLNFQAKKNYKTVYRIASTHLRNYSVGILISNLYTDSKSGVAYLRHGAPPFNIIWLATEFEAIGKNSTSVDIYYAVNDWFNTWQDRAYTLKKEILSNDKN